MCTNGAVSHGDILVPAKLNTVQVWSSRCNGYIGIHWYHTAVLTVHMTVEKGQRPVPVKVCLNPGTFGSTWLHVYVLSLSTYWS